MASTKSTDEGPHTKKWECGDPYQYQIPANGNHWENLLTPLMESDKTQCEGWKDEVQNLLIFAGLFSGVLTAFVIESYPGLQPDPNDVMIALLTRIATRLDNPLNGTTSSPQQINALPSISPVARSIRINTFWFISLVLSLTTVLIGIISLQWLREHQQYPTSLSPKERFALFNMRARGLKAWYVPQIFAALPVLLQFALVLFFVGLVDFLLAPGIKVAIPVIITIGIPLVFLVWTTVMPSLQAFALCLPIAGRVERVPEQCPYKSTQSRIFRHIITFSRRVFLLCSRSATAFHSFTVLLPLSLVKSSMKSPPNSGKDKRRVYEYQRKHLFHVVFDTWKQQKWLMFDQYWLKLRNAYARSISDGEWWMNDHFTYAGIGPLYDLTTGISSSMVENIDSASAHASGYYCVQDLTSSVIGKNDSASFDHRTYNRYLQKLLGDYDYLSSPFPTFSGILEKPPLDLLQDENSFIFLSQFGTQHLTFLQHFTELHIRIMNYLCPEKPLTVTSNVLGLYPAYPDFRLWDWYETPDNILEAAFDSHISAQFSFVIESFVKTVADQEIEDGTFPRSLHAHRLSELLRFAVFRKSENTIQPTLDFLTTALNRYNASDNNFGQRSDFIFYASAFYARFLMISESWLFDDTVPDWANNLNPLVEAFLPILHRYLQERGTPDITLGEHLGVPAQSNSEWWGFLNRSRKKDHNSAEEPNIKHPPIEPDLKPGPEKGLVLGMNTDAGDLV